MKRKIIVTAVAATAAALPGGLGATAPALATPGAAGNVTKTQAHKVHKDTSIIKAHRVLGYKGKKTHTWKLYHNETIYWG
jgi:hypothetical protein